MRSLPELVPDINVLQTLAPEELGYEMLQLARTNEQNTMATHCADMKTQKGKLSLDALIHACGRNLGMPICTKNLDDFQKLNRAPLLAALITRFHYSRRNNCWSR